jgi:hypothetical protein
MNWVYKCNSKGYPYQSAWGDWRELFASTRARPWGSTQWTPRLEHAGSGDTIVAYQTDRNELVGIARVVRWQKRGRYRDLILQPVRTIGTKVRPLKQGDPSVARIPALQPGPIQTLYPISAADTERLLRAAKANIEVDPDAAEHDAVVALRGGGFGTPAENKLVEEAAVTYAIRYLRNKGWSVRNVSKENRGYDLMCVKGRDTHRVEVKGARGSAQRFLITANEKRSWLGDESFVLAFVSNALSESRRLTFFSGPKSSSEFAFRAISYLAARRPGKLDTKTSK